MAFVSEKTQRSALSRHGVTVQTEFFEEGSLKIRTSDHTRDDDVKNGIILAKKYFRGGKLLRREKEFSPMMMYTYIGGSVLKNEVTCPNCGQSGVAAEFAGGCPYCGTVYNIEYADRQDGGQFLADRRVKDPKFYLTALLISFAICLPISFFLVKTTGRTFLFFDKLKAVLFGAVPALALFYVFYVLNAFVITRRAEEKYRKQSLLIRNFEKDLLSMGISMSRFYNNLHSELACHFYGKDGASGEKREEVLDFDILECTDFAVGEASGGQTEISLKILLRKILADGEQVRSEKDRYQLVMRDNKIVPDELHPGVNIIQCHNCGGSIDVTKDRCEYCGTRVNYRQRLYLTSIQ